MADGMAKLEAVRQAREKLGTVSSREMAAYVEREFGLSIEPVIVTVLLGTLAEREHLEASRRRALEEAGEG